MWNTVAREEQSDYARVGIRWTVGDVSVLGFEALRLSIWGAYNVFGRDASYAVCVNTIPIKQARRAVGRVPDAVLWLDASHLVPAFVRAHLDRAMAEGVGWKFAPLRVFPAFYEIALDNDCIIWSLPRTIREWLEIRDARTCVIAEDVRVCLGQFADLCAGEPRNSGIRGLPPGLDLARALQETLAARPVTMTSELDEQGLQVAALTRTSPVRVVSLNEVSICSPFPPHLPTLGTHGAHFVGLNAKHLPWDLNGVPAVQHIRAHWDRCATELYARIGISPLDGMSQQAEMLPVA
jgi:hypothetical protein